MNTAYITQRCWIGVLVFLALGWATQAAAGGAIQMPRLAPINPAFLQQTAAPALRLTGPHSTTLLESAVLGTGTGSGAAPHSHGYLPSPVDRSHMIGLTPSIVTQNLHSQVSYPASFDLRTLGNVTRVKDQGACGDCWSFSTIASAESNALLSGIGTYDFSENHQNVLNGFDYPPCLGGNADIAGAYQTRWGNTDSLASGLVYETDDPYTGTTGTAIAGLSPRVHMQEFLVLPDRANGTDNNNYKYALQNDGAVDVSMYMDDGISNGNSSSAWNPTTNAYYYSGSTAPNHEVALVGWDDNYLATNFSTVPPGNGAFIAKNQWGTSWGDNGYFYISYYDSQLSQVHVFRTPQGIHNYAHSYLYDPFLETSSTGYQSDIAFGANVFTAVASETLQAVAFYTLTVNTSYQISIYTNVASSPDTGVLSGGSVNTSGSIPYSGYHTITLSHPVSLVANKKFAVVIQFTTPGYNYPIPMEVPISGLDSAASASAGQSYISFDGNTWTDLTSWSPNSNVTIRAFTQGSSASIPDVPTIGTATAGNAQALVSFSAPANNGGSAITSYQVTSSPGNITATGSASPITVTNLTNGTAYTFTVTATNSTGTSGASAPSDSVTPQAGVQNQTISALNFRPTTLSVGGTTTVSAMATSGLPVSFSSSTPTVCSVTGDIVTGIAAGTCTIAANQAGSSSYNIAPQVTNSLTIAKSNQTIGLVGVMPAMLSVGGTATLSAGATSGLSVVFHSSTPAVCTVSGNTVTFLAVGICTVAANQSGNSSYTAAPQRIKNMLINPGQQVIGALTFTPSVLSVRGTATVSATATSGLPVSFRSMTLGTCATSGNNGSTLIGIAPGTCTIAAIQSGNRNWIHAASVTQSCTVTR